MDLYTLFLLFWPEWLWSEMAKNTNAYAKIQQAMNKNSRLWWPTNEYEIRVFTGVMIYIGMHKVPEFKDYWNQDLVIGSIHIITYGEELF